MGKRLNFAQMGLAVLLAVGANCLHAQDWEGSPVKEVRHQPEDPRQKSLDAAALGKILVQKAGQPFSGEKIRESLQRLYNTGRFADIQVDARREPDGVVVTFLTRSHYFVGSVLVQGVAAPPSESQLRSATQLLLGQLCTEETIQDAAQGLRRVLEDEGYFHPKIVASRQRHPDTQQIDITFEVETGERARIGEVLLSGTPEFSAARLMRQAKWKQGKLFTSERIQNGLGRIRDLYRKEDYLGASVAIARRVFRPESNRVDLELAVAAGTKVEVEVVGAEMSRSRIERYIPVFEEGALDEDLLREGERNLRDYYQSQGYFDVEVSYLRRALDSGRVRIEYQIDRGPRQSLQEIRILGNRYFQTEVLRERMRVQPASLRDRQGHFSSRMLELDLAAIRTLYRTNGFADVEVTADRESRGPDSEREIVLSLRVQEGPQTRVGQFSITGNHSFPPERLEYFINAASGQPYSDSLVTSDRDNLLTFYFNQGFPDAQFRWVATPSDDGRRMDLQYILQEGSREYVGHIFVDGLRHTRRGIVNRQLRLRDGQPLSQGELLETQRRLYDLGIFNQVEMAIQNPGGRETERNVLLYLEESRRYTVSLGLGAEVGRFGGKTEDVQDVEGQNDFSPDISLEITRLNVGGRGHTASLRSRFSSLQKRAGLTYSAPRFLNLEWLNASVTALFDETRDVRTFTARRVEGSIQFENRRSRATTLLYRYAFRRVTVDTSALRISPEQIPVLTRPALVGMLSQTLIRDTRDVPNDAREGTFSSADLGIAAKPLGSEKNFLRFLFQNSSFHRLGRQLVLARSVQFGLQTPFGRGSRIEAQPGEEGPTSEAEIPIAERFFSGGGDSHRGFAVNQAGPRDPITGFALGGNALLFLNTELRFPIWRQSIGGVLFHDAGNVFTRIGKLSLRQHQKNDQDFNYISHAVGLGLRYRTPVGPVRLDVGYNVNPPRFLIQTGASPVPQSLSRWQVLFSIGQTF